MPALGASYLGETYLAGVTDFAEYPEFPTGLSGLINSAIAEFIAKQGDNGPAWIDVLSYSDRKIANLQGCSVKFVMRNFSSRAPVILTGETEIVNPLEGEVLFYPSVSDTSLAGNYMAVWIVTYPSGRQMTFPTEGYREIRIEPSLTAESRQLVNLTDVKNYLNIQANDYTHDSKLIKLIEAITPLVENVTGPIIPKIFEEWHMGGNYFISLRRRPSSGYGTSPVLTLMACSEYRGPIEYPLSIIQNPAEGTIYSCMLESRAGVVERRTSGGGVMAFPPMANSVHVVYQSGQETVPANVLQGALEAVRINWQTTQNVGRGALAQADILEGGPPMGFFLPRRVYDLLSPTKRAPPIC
jgi:hypothetical protein